MRGSDGVLPDIPLSRPRGARALLQIIRLQQHSAVS